ncbi:PREDICTED: suppressor of SWI4 1 homolog [Dipodomys ordii]|uniref:Suppressor of SWI4 1 homolog n=1 Tax=Dipodomys ordii TaxID=10020 RepID=A0A1S3GL14_DIPOR|nr:PREDICTED: suppressor of SWI4 1 homolog [Dipodomys ordii]
MGQSGKSRHQKRARAQAQQRNLEAYAAQPHSFVFTRGRAGRSVRQLSLDLRRVVEPLTASRLQVRKKNSLKDCVAVAGPLGVTHFLILSKTDTSVYFKLMRLPGGPTLTFQVNKYTLVRDVVSSLRRHRMHEQQFAHPPLLVLNSFGPHGMHVKLMATMFQNLFPSINVHKVNLNTIKRCLLINYNPDSQELDFRHYSIKVVPVGASRGMKKLLQEKFPNMSRLQDISELLATGAGLSESEAEPDGEHNVTELPQAIAGRGNMRAQQSAVRLTEIGPRMTLQLMKIQEGVGAGNVLFHSFVHKTEEELQAILAAKEEKLRLKAQRREKQAEDVLRKRERREANKPLLLTLLAFGALGRAVLRSHSMSAAEKLRVALLVAAGVAVHASSYVPYLVLRVLNVAARQRWLARCPSFADEAQAVRALELGPYLGFQVTRGLVPLAMCIHPLLYMAVVPSLGCPACRAGRDLRDQRPGQDQPLPALASPEARPSLLLSTGPCDSDKAG